jgi:hypothetical protein
MHVLPYIKCVSPVAACFLQRSSMYPEHKWVRCSPRRGTGKSTSLSDTPTNWYELFAEEESGGKRLPGLQWSDDMEYNRQNCQRSLERFRELSASSGICTEVYSVDRGRTFWLVGKVAHAPHVSLAECVATMESNSTTCSDVS